MDVLLKYAEWLIKPEKNNGTWVSDRNFAAACAPRQCSPGTRHWSLTMVWNENEEFITERIITDVAKGRSGYGQVTVLHSSRFPFTTLTPCFDPSLGCDDHGDDATFQL